MTRGPDISPRKRRWKTRPASRAAADTMDEANLEYRRAKAEVAQLQAAELRGELVRREELERRYRARQTEARKILEVLGRRIAPQLYGREIHEIEALIDQAVRYALTRLSEPVHEPKKAKRETRRRRGA